VEMDEGEVAQLHQLGVARRESRHLHRDTGQDGDGPLGGAVEVERKAEYPVAAARESTEAWGETSWTKARWGRWDWRRGPRPAKSVK
jgi:hypothetical protein